MMFSMKRHEGVAAAACAAILSLCAGCFDHREAPKRPVTATSLNEAATIGATVERVVLNGSGLKSVPAELANFPALATLHMRGCPLEDFAGLAPLASLRELDISENRLEKAPAEIASLSSLEHLYLASCSLKEFPDSVAGLANLTYLNLDRNEITSLPDALPASLKWLRLNHNKLASLPDSIGALTGLKRLYLGGNQLTSLPGSIASLQSLEDIALGNNRLEEFPAVLVSIPSLRNIDIRGNPSVTKLPEDLTGFAGLRTLTLSGCRIPKEERDRISAALPDCVINF